jgi:hypothetical protein
MLNRAYRRRTPPQRKSHATDLQSSVESGLAQHRAKIVQYQHLRWFSAAKQYRGLDHHDKLPSVFSVSPCKKSNVRIAALTIARDCSATPAVDLSIPDFSSPAIYKSHSRKRNCAPNPRQAFTFPAAAQERNVSGATPSIRAAAPVRRSRILGSLLSTTAA